MAKRKYYAVKKGLKKGIFYTWEECRRQVHGYPCAEYKSFGTEEEAKNYLGMTVKGAKGKEGGRNDCSEKCVEIYVDGSYQAAANEFSYGMVILRDGKTFTHSEKIKDEELAKMHNVAGEIKGAEAAMQYALDHHMERVVIYHDYEGIAKWCTGEWRANKTGTQSYRDFYNAAKEKIKIDFIKVEGHSNNKYNDMADKLAKEALGIGISS